MENTVRLDEFQKIIDKEFNKILKVNINDRNFKIAITKDEVPKIKHFVQDDNSILISFDDSSDNILNTSDFNIVRNEEKDIVGVWIQNINKLKSENFLMKFRRMLLNEIKDYPERNSNEIIHKHKQKRIAHAISEILKTVPNNI